MSSATLRRYLGRIALLDEGLAMMERIFDENYDCTAYFGPFFQDIAGQSIVLTTYTQRAKVFTATPEQPR